jgi:SAM-dependent methyltransferase
MTTASSPLIDDELDVLASLVPLGGQNIIELGCGAARLARDLLTRYPDSRWTGLEVDARQHAKNLAAPQAGLHFMAGVAQSLPFTEASFDLAMMLKSLHHVPMSLMAQALGEAARVLRPGGHLYVSEPVYDGPLNEVIRLFNDEGVVRAAAQAAVDEALHTGMWVQVAEHRFDMPVFFRDFAEFEQRMMRPTYAIITSTRPRSLRFKRSLRLTAAQKGRASPARCMCVCCGGCDDVPPSVIALWEVQATDGQ